MNVLKRPGDKKPGFFNFYAMPSVKCANAPEAKKVRKEANVLPLEAKKVRKEANVLPPEAKKVRKEANVLPTGAKKVRKEANVLPPEAKKLGWRPNIGLTAKCWWK
jgi:hypothetical protein